MEKKTDSPVLSTEDQREYADLYADFVVRLKPRDVIETQLLDHLVNVTWLARRYTRHKTVTVERYCAENQIKPIQDRTPTDLEYNRALEKSAAFQEQLDKWVKNAAVQFEDVLHAFEHYRNNLSRKLRQISAQIVRPEFKDLEGRLKNCDSSNLVPVDKKETAERGIQPDNNSEG